MERSTSPLPFRRAVAAGVFVVGLALGLASLRLWAVTPAAAEPPPATDDKRDAPPEQPRFPKEALRYGGKSFEQWRTELLTELKPAVRIDGMRALATFGANGYGAEATRALLELVRGYDTNSADPDDQQVLREARGAVAKVGDAALPVLREGLKDKNRNVCRFAATALAGNSAWAATATPELLAALRDSDPYVRCDAVNALGSAKPRPKAYLPALLQSVKDKDSRVRNATIDNLGKIGPAAREAVPALLDILDNDAPTRRVSAVQALIRIKPEAKLVVPALIRAVQGTTEDLQMWAAKALGALGPDAAEAVPALIAALKQTINANQPSLADEVIEALGRIGPAARDAAPLIRGAGRRWQGSIAARSEIALQRIEK
jgi:HEAT repeat protein